MNLIFDGIARLMRCTFLLGRLAIVFFFFTAPSSTIALSVETDRVYLGKLDSLDSGPLTLIGTEQLEGCRLLTIGIEQVYRSARFASLKFELRDASTMLMSVPVEVAFQTVGGRELAVTFVCVSKVGVSAAFLILKYQANGVDLFEFSVDL